MILLLVLGTLPLLISPAPAEDRTRRADQGVIKANNLFARPGAVFRGKLMVGEETPYAAAVFPVVPPAVPGSYDGATFARVGAGGLGDGFTNMLYPTAV